MAIAMPIQQDIRRYDRQGMPHARIARELGVDRGTVAKYARQEDCSPQPKRDRRFGRKTDAYAALIDQMLEADRMMPASSGTRPDGSSTGWWPSMGSTARTAWCAAT